MCCRDFPGHALVRSPPAKAEGTGSIPGLGIKTPHSTWQLSPCTTTREATAMRSLLTTVKNSPAYCNHRKPAHNNEDPAWPTIKKYLKNKENHSYPLWGGIYIYTVAPFKHSAQSVEKPQRRGVQLRLKGQPLKVSLRRGHLSTFC